jgi:hypothetical protein
MIAMRRWFGLLLPTLALGCTPDTFETGDATQGDGAVSDSATDVTCDGAAFLRREGRELLLRLRREQHPVRLGQLR